MAQFYGRGLGRHTLRRLFDEVIQVDIPLIRVFDYKWHPFSLSRKNNIHQIYQIMCNEYRRLLFLRETSKELAKQEFVHNAITYQLRNTKF